MRVTFSAAIMAVLAAAATAPALSQVKALPPCLPQCEGEDLRRADLRWADLSGADLSGADLSYADLSWADLAQADLSGATVYRADLIGANLSGIDLTGVRGCDLSRRVPNECRHYDDFREAISRFMRTFRYGDKEDLADHIRFPLRRSYPIPPIERDEFLERYGEVFDRALTDLISNSSLKDWRERAYSVVLSDADSGIGISLESYAIPGASMRWIASSEYERVERERLLQLRDTLRTVERLQLHASLRDYESPVLEWEAATRRVRVDRMDIGEFRYAAWKTGKSHTDEPDIIINGGMSYFAGSSCGTEATRLAGYAGGVLFVFVNGEYLYEVDAFDCWCQGPIDNPDGPAGNQDCDYNLRVWHNPRGTAIVPEGHPNWWDLEDRYELILHEPFEETTNVIDSVLHADYRARSRERRRGGPN